MVDIMANHTAPRGRHQRARQRARHAAGAAEAAVDTTAQQYPGGVMGAVYLVTQQYPGFQGREPLLRDMCAFFARSFLEPVILVLDNFAVGLLGENFRPDPRYRELRGQIVIIYCEVLLSFRGYARGLGRIQETLQYHNDRRPRHGWAFPEHFLEQSFLQHRFLPQVRSSACVVVQELHAIAVRSLPRALQQVAVVDTTLNFLQLRCPAEEANAPAPAVRAVAVQAVRQAHLNLGALRGLAMSPSSTRAPSSDRSSEESTSSRTRASSWESLSQSTSSSTRASSWENLSQSTMALTWTSSSDSSSQSAPIISRTSSLESLPQVPEHPDSNEVAQELYGQQTRELDAALSEVTFAPLPVAQPVGFMVRAPDRVHAEAQDVAQDILSCGHLINDLHEDCDKCQSHYQMQEDLFKKLDGELSQVVTKEEMEKDCKVNTFANSSRYLKIAVKNEAMERPSAGFEFSGHQGATSSSSVSTSSPGQWCQVVWTDVRLPRDNMVV